MALCSTGNPGEGWRPFCAQCETRLDVKHRYDYVTDTDTWSFSCHGRNGVVEAPRRSAWKPVLPSFVFKGRRAPNWRPRCVVCSQKNGQVVRVEAMCREAALASVVYTFHCHGWVHAIDIPRKAIAALAEDENEYDLLPDALAFGAITRAPWEDTRTDGKFTAKRIRERVRSGDEIRERQQAMAARFDDTDRAPPAKEQVVEYQKPKARDETKVRFSRIEFWEKED